MLQLGSSVTELGGVGEKISTLLVKLGIQSVSDLLLNYPRRYDDYSDIKKISELRPGIVTIQGQILRAATKRTKRRNFTVTEAVIDDGSGAVRATWFNQPYLAATLPKLVDVYVSGVLEFKYGQYSLVSPTVEKTSDFPKDTARIVPIYRETKGLSSKQIRGLIKQTLPLVVKLDNLLPVQVAKSFSLVTKQEAVREIHFPSSQETLVNAQKYLAVEELFTLILTSLVIKADMKTETGPKIRFSKSVAQNFVAGLKFKLTDAQRLTAWQILQDMEKSAPMNRLLEGDVGSGKTVVAALAAVMAVDAGYQVAILAPTETLARQHHQTLTVLLSDKEINIGLMVGSLKAPEKSATVERIKTKDDQIIIGTHALLEERIRFHELGLVVIDEQHRFGVNQRSVLRAKAKQMPHLLTMSATPIPRSLALTIYGDLDISIINEMPKGRQKIETKLALEGDRRRVYYHIEEQVKSGRQAYVICPLISESDTLGVKSVEAELSKLRTGPFQNLKLAGLHGRMKPAEKIKVMEGFKAGSIDILVSTTVVEVGVDVPNATVIMIEGAERFGLAQLHQLRGRVGRGTHKAYCYLLTTSDTFARYRLSLLEKHNDGFELAQKDLELRGPGQIYGQLQHGILDLRMADLSDTKLIAEVRKVAQEFLSTENLLKHKVLLEVVNKLKAVTTLN